MALKFNIQIDDNAVQEAIDSRPTFQKYDGPTPPPGFYHFKLTKLWAGQNRDGTEVLIASLTIDEEGDGETDNSVYNGFQLLDRMVIPMDKSNQYFDMQIRSMDDFFKAISNGEYTIFDFKKDAAQGKILEDGEANKMGTPIKQIGKLKIGTDRTLRAKTKQNGEYTNLHFIDLDASIEGKGKAAAQDDDDIDLSSPWAGGDEDESDIDSLLGDI